MRVVENSLSNSVIGAAIEVHRALGPGLIEKVYEEALCHELNLRGIQFHRQRPVTIGYKGIRLSADLRLDLLVDGKIIVDLKAKEQTTPLDRAQLRTYLKLSGLRLGLLINFNVEILKDGISRVVNGLEEQNEEPSIPDLRG